MLPARREAGPFLMAKPRASTIARENWNQRRRVRREEGSVQEGHGKRWGTFRGGEGVEGCGNASEDSFPPAAVLK